MRLEWKHVLSAEHSGGGLVTSIARLDGSAENTRLAQVLDVEQILRDVMPNEHKSDIDGDTGRRCQDSTWTAALAAHDSAVARMMIEQGLKAMGGPHVMTKTGKEAWDMLETIRTKAEAEGKTVQDKVALVSSTPETPVMDGFTLTRNIKQDGRFKGIPVIIHSSLTGTANEGHVKSVGADAYIAKFAAQELGRHYPPGAVALGLFLG